MRLNKILLMLTFLVLLGSVVGAATIINTKSVTVTEVDELNRGEFEITMSVDGKLDEFTLKNELYKYCMMTHPASYCKPKMVKILEDEITRRTEPKTEPTEPSTTQTITANDLFKLERGEGK